MIIYLAAIDAPEDRDTFVALYETYRNLMFHVAHKILRNRPMLASLMVQM